MPTFRMLMRTLVCNFLLSVYRHIFEMVSVYRHIFEMVSVYRHIFEMVFIRNESSLLRMHGVKPGSQYDAWRHNTTHGSA